MTEDTLLAKELAVKPHQVWAAIRLLDGGATVPFIARYRKEQTGGLSDTHLRLLADRLEYVRGLEALRKTILDSIQEQGKMTPVLKEAIEKAETKAQLEDLYLPFKPKRNSRGEAARAAGLEPLALKLINEPMTDPLTEAQKYVDELKGITTVEQALNGARDILAEKFSETPDLIGFLREKFWKEGWLYSKAVSEAKSLHPDSQKFRDYFDFREAFVKIPSHRLLAIMRGRAESVLSTRLETTGLLGYTDEKNEEAEYVEAILKKFNIRLGGKPADRWLLESAKYSWKYKIRISLEIDIMMRLKKAAEEEAIKVFAENIKEILLAGPAGSRAVMGLDPGIRTGVKVACVDKTGKVLECAVIYPHPPQEDRIGAMKAIRNLIVKHNIEFIAIGNGTASRETESMVQDLLKAVPDLKAKKVIVSEAGASVYSASELASKELPDLDVTLRGAVSIARRLQDPLAELVKIEPKAIGVGQYQHDVNQFRLEKMLKSVVEDCVNAVGVEVNTASPALLSYVAGLNKQTADSIVEYRNKNGLLKSREEFKKIAGFGPKTFEQAAGFLRIQNGDNPLDRSAVHPESYPVVQKILDRVSLDLDTLLGNSALLKNIKPEEIADETFGHMTVSDILAELDKPGRDPRPEFKTAVFDAKVNSMEDLIPGLILEGVITNVANFGAFVDIGVHQDGLVHISQISNEFVQDPRTVVKTGQIVKVKVLEIDKMRKRISLTMRLKETIRR